MSNISNSVFIGPIPIDEALFLDPPKKDWKDFHDFLLLKIWDREASKLAQQYNVNYFSTVNAARKYKRCRCDGMHFGSYSKLWNCNSSRFIWKHELCIQAKSLSLIT